jgi:hypothetical protein
LEDLEKKMDLPKIMELNIVSMIMYGKILALKSLNGKIGLFYIDYEVLLQESEDPGAQVF